MMTQTHLLVAATLFASPNRPARHNAAVLIGSFVPDLAIYMLFAWSKIMAIPERQLWGQIYFSEPMLTYTAIGNSAPLYVTILLVGLAMAYRARPAAMAGNTGTIAVPRFANIYILFALGALTHVAGDFPVHVNDAHPHFWPLTDWRFVSPVSYWDSRHHGDVFSIFEAIGGMVLAVILFRRFKARWVRALTGLLIAGYVAVPAYFYLVLGGN